jgi:hypothetical protein
MTSISDQLNFGPGLDVAAHSAASISKLQVPENQDNLLLIDADGRAVLLRDQTPQPPSCPTGRRPRAPRSPRWHGRPRPRTPSCRSRRRRPAAHPRLRHAGPTGAHLDQLHHQLQAHFSHPDDHDSFRRPGTTLTLLEIPPGQPPMLYHAGDSRLYEITAQARSR